MNARERLIESTRELLWERGYVGTSPKGIQQRANVGQGSMYHHFAGKEDLARAAIAQTADDLRAAADELLSAPGTAADRFTAYLRRERDVLRGCPVGRLTQDPDVMATPALRAPIEETFTWLRARLAEVLQEGVDRGELNPSVNPVATASAIVACLQGGYVLARAADSTEPFDQAIAGILALLDANAARPAAGDGAPIRRTVVLDQPLAEPQDTHRVEVRRITIAPGHAGGLHVHNGPVFGSVETGSAVYQIEGDAASVLRPGDVFYEPAGVRIARFDARDEGVTFLGYFLLAAGETPEITFPEAADG
ncbi:TetR family transcriptional regulator C-terminal domain-containing protein [Actinomadura decatromicini]|uniref:TetR family transcriptional regulator n=1 Tax=Actinomadura decatromicini TaxID=2604572 RepID=A0A5D3F791_9ACTN|nr:TetR family transcriptional regulator [Actinomadura decatromicini]TYK43929.1 TetR family transcriptional regulator [Actinomadura decatromicini]